jgi:outer membrane immunogenic protein
MKYLFAVPFAAALAFSTVAFAADLPAAAPVYAPAVTPFTWSGIYFGAQGGYGWGSTSQTFEGGVAPSGNSNPQGWLGGGYLGFNWQINNIVLGLEGDFEAADLNGSFRNTSGVTSAGSADMNWDASIRGRLGMAFDRSLLYATGGVAFAEYDLKGGPDFGSPIPCCGFTDTLTGWTVGAGFEQAWTKHLTTRIEYRYTDYGKSSGGLPPTFPGVKMSTKNTTNVVRVGVGYKF